MRKIIKKVQKWGEKRGLHWLPAIRQVDKLKEEVDELDNALKKADRFEIQDGIGDIQVVLIQICRNTGLDYDECLEVAYEEIKDRKGKIVDGLFVKDE